MATANVQPVPKTSSIDFANRESKKSLPSAELLRIILFQRYDETRHPD